MEYYEELKARIKTVIADRQAEEAAGVYPAQAPGVWQAIDPLHTPEYRERAKLTPLQRLQQDIEALLASDQESGITGEVSQ